MAPPTSKLSSYGTLNWEPAPDRSSPLGKFSKLAVSSERPSPEKALLEEKSVDCPNTGCLLSAERRLPHGKVQAPKERAPHFSGLKSADGGHRHSPLHQPSEVRKWIELLSPPGTRPQWGSGEAQLATHIGMPSQGLLHC